MNDKLWYLSPATAWEEALPIGNGKQGAMIYGGACRERISLNEDTLWSGTPKDKNNQGAAQYLPEIRKLMESGDVVGAEEIINRHTLGEMSETYLPFCDMEITTRDAAVTDYRRELDMKNGLFVMTCLKDGKAYSETAFASYPDGLIVIKIRSERPEDLNLSLSSKLKCTVEPTKNGAVIYGIAPESNLPTVRGVTPPTIYGDEKTSDAIKFFGAFEIITDGEKPSPTAVRGATDIEIRVSLATSFVSPLQKPSADAKMRAALRLADAGKYSYDELQKRHTDDFSSLYSRFEIEIGESEPNVPTDERLKDVCRGEDDPGFAALLVKYGRYLMISSSRSGSAATNLQGIWNEKLHPAWCSNYTLDINTEMNYWGAEPTGLSECADPLCDFIAALAVNGEKTARLHYGCRGWVAHSSSDIWAYTTTCGPVNERRGCSRYATWQGGSGWLCRHLYDRYLYTGDKEFLSRAFPIMRAAARFYLDFMYEDKDGNLVTSPSLSPENIYIKNGQVVAADIMPTMDKEIITELFGNCVAAADILGVKSGTVEEIKAALPKIKGIKINANGTVSEWSRDYEEAEPDHRHVSHLFGLYPSDAINASTKNLSAAAEKTLDKRGTQGTGWGIMWKTCMYARLGSADKAYGMFKLIYNRLPPDAPMGNSGGGLYDNLFDACPPFQIDGNFGAIAAVLEMLCRDDGKGEFTLLPACPKEWRTGSVCGLKLKGGKTVDFSWRDGKTTCVVVRDDA